MTNEAWRPVLGYERRYEVSSLGRVRSIQCRGRPRKVPLVRPPHTRPDGYVYITLTDDTGRARCRAVYHLVLEAFVGPRPVGSEGGHKDDDPQNNAASNLSWVTKKENAAQRVSRGRHARGVAMPHAVLNEDKVREIRRLYPAMSYAALAQKFGAGHATIEAVVKRRKWAHVQ